MPYCSNCGHLVSDEARFCSNCGTPASGERPAAAQPDAVPGWLGWLAVLVVLLTSVIGLVLYSIWAYRRGRWDGVGRQYPEQPSSNFAWKTIWWGLLAIVPVLGWYAVVHLSTQSYKHGLRVGAKEGTAPNGFTSLSALAVVVSGVVVLTGAIIVGVGLAVSDNGNAQISVEALTPTPRPRPTPKPTPVNTDIEFTFNLGRDGVLEAECFQSDRPFDCYRTSTGAVRFEAQVKNNSECGIATVIVHVELKDGNGKVVKRIDEPVTTLGTVLGPREAGAVQFVASPPEELGWEIYDSNVTWSWRC